MRKDILDETPKEENRLDVSTIERDERRKSPSDYEEQLETEATARFGRKGLEIGSFDALGGIHGIYRGFKKEEERSTTTRRLEIDEEHFYSSATKTSRKRRRTFPRGQKVFGKEIRGRQVHIEPSRGSILDSW